MVAVCFVYSRIVVFVLPAPISARDTVPLFFSLQESYRRVLLISLPEAIMISQASWNREGERSIFFVARFLVFCATATTSLNSTYREKILLVTYLVDTAWLCGWEYLVVLFRDDSGRFCSCRVGWNSWQSDILGFIVLFDLIARHEREEIPYRPTFWITMTFLLSFARSFCPLLSVPCLPSGRSSSAWYPGISSPKFEALLVDISILEPNSLPSLFTVTYLLFQKRNTYLAVFLLQKVVISYT